MSSRFFTNINKWSPSFDEWTHCLSCVTEVERSKALSFVFQKDVKSSIIGRLLIRYFLCNILNCKNIELDIALSENNRPYVRNHKVDFNISHDGGLVVLFGAMDACVGVDVVHVKRQFGSGTIERFLTLMRRQLTPYEWQWINQNSTAGSNISTTDEDKLFDFYRCWCMKESYVKAEGVGLGIDFNSLECIFNTHIPDNNFDDVDNKLKSSIHSVKLPRLKRDGIFNNEWIFIEDYLLNEYIVCSSIKSKFAIEHGRITEILPKDILSTLTPLSTDNNHNFNEQWDCYTSKEYKT